MRNKQNYSLIRGFYLTLVGEIEIYETHSQRKFMTNRQVQRLQTSFSLFSSRLFVSVSYIMLKYRVEVLICLVIQIFYAFGLPSAPYNLQNCFDR